MPIVSPRPPRGDESTLCSAIAINGKGCKGDPFPGAPVILCAKHLRQAYEFAADLLDVRMSDLLREQRCAEQEAEERQRRAEEERRSLLSGPREPGKLSGLVYFVRFGNRIKIGFTANLPNRMKAIPHDEILMVTPGTMDDERQCHEAFAHLREKGEWFRADPELIGFIDQMPSNEASRHYGIR